MNEKHLMPLQKGLVKFQGAHSVDYLMAGLTIGTISILVVYLNVQKHTIKGLSSAAIVG